MRHFIFVLLLACTYATAAPAQDANAEFTRRVVEAIATQRNVAESTAAGQQARAELAEEKLAAVQKELDEARALAATRWWRKRK